MYHVMIVDDELYARTRLKVDLCLERDGFLVDQEAANGQEALEKIRYICPDILLTDMRMPGMNGVDLIAQVKKMYHDLPVIALSGYEDFVYVRSSLKLGAIDYLLKHDLNREVVLEALQKCAEQIRQSQQKEKDTQILQTYWQNSEKESQRQLVLSLLNGDAIHPEILSEQLPFLIHGNNIQLILMQLDNIHKLEQEGGKIELVMLSPSILSILQEVIRQYAQGIIAEIGGGEFVTLISFEGRNSQQYFWNISRQLVQSLRHNLEKYTNLTASFVLGKLVQQPSGLPSCYRQTRQEMSLRYLTGHGSLIDVSESRTMNPGKFVTLDTVAEKQIANAVERRDHEHCMAAVQAVFDGLLHREADRTSCQIICLELLNLVIRNIKAIPLSNELQEFCTLMRVEILNSDNIQENRRLIVSAYNRLFDFFKTADRFSHYNSNTIKALEYVHAHCQDDLGLDAVAGKLNVSKSYLSRIFSHDCGKSFTEYVACYRVEQAKVLLAQGVTIKEVAERVGIGNQSYFFRVFKTYTGTTPHGWEKKK